MRSFFLTFSMKDEKRLVLGLSLTLQSRDHFTQHIASNVCEFSYSTRMQVC